MILRRVLAWCLLALLLPGLASAQAWNYVQRMPEVADFRTLSVDVEIGPGLSEGDRVYVAPAQGYVGGTGFYFGLQTDLHESKSGRMRGKGVVFSRWGAAAPDDAKPGAGGWVEAQRHKDSREGDFTGIRLPYEWRPGRYTFRMASRTAAPQPGQWMELSLHDHQSGRLVEVGALRFPAPPPAALYPDLRSFVEFYGPLRQVAGHPDLVAAPEVTIRFGPPRVNGAIQPVRASASPGRKLPQLARVTPLPDGGAEMAVGGTAPAP